MEQHLFEPGEPRPRGAPICPTAPPPDLEAEARRYEALVGEPGLGVDLQLLGIGHNGHIGFNEP